MRYLAALILLVCFSCNQQGMTEEHRQKLKLEVAERKIKRHTDADILVEAKSKAEQVYKKARALNNAAGRMKWIALQDTLTSSYEQKIQEAYQYAFEQRLEQYDNIEDLGNGTIIFTRPDQLHDSIPGFWVIELDKKKVIKGLQ